MTRNTHSLEYSLAERLKTFFSVLVACVLLTAALVRLQFEISSPLAQVLPVVICAFSIGYWVPQRFGFVVLSIASIAACWLFVGPYHTVTIVAGIAGYVAIISIFSKSKWRIISTILFTLFLGYLRLGKMQLPFIPIAAPIIGSMVMFRFVLMLHEHHYHKPATTWWAKFSYLLMLPALAFPLFPIVDYKTYVNNYKPNDRKTLGVGLTRIAVGTLLMLLYRILYLYFIPSYTQIADAAGSFTYMLGSYLYILNIMGILWIGIGYLSILGFEMPPVFNYVFLIDSFRDIWRRINTYWRDFMAKIVYYPLYFKLRKKTKYAILITALITLCTSASLHGWQWFWLQGTIVIQGTALLFWTILGIVISINLTIQQKQEQDVDATNKARRNNLLRALRITGMLLFMSFMWSLWNSTTLSEWLHFLAYYTKGTVGDWGLIVGIIAAIFMSAFLYQLLPKKTAGYHFLNHSKSAFALSIVGAMLVLLTIPSVTNLLPTAAQRLAESISKMNLTSADQVTSIENYYNKMLASDGIGLRPWEIHTSGAPARSGLDNACVRRNDILVRELIPGRTTELEGWTIVTNKWGMRDQNYTLEKPEGVYRIAILGASYEMGSGVSQDSIFENQVEQMLLDSLPSARIEILNFSVGGYHLPQQIWVAENKIDKFSPDLVLCFVHPSDATRTSNFMATLVKNGTNLLYAELFAIKEESGVEQYMSDREMQNRLYPFSNRIATWSLSRIAVASEAMKAEFHVVYIPSMVTSTDDEFYAKLFTQSKNEESALVRTRFHSLSMIFEGQEERFKLKNDPSHPNAQGHYAIAVGLTKELLPYLRKKLIKPQPTN